jgi:hypothetical protein
VSEFNKRLNEALKYNADQQTVDNLLGQLSSPEHTNTRRGYGGDHHLRLVAADALQDGGREDEAHLLRTPEQHVVIEDGKVKKGSFTFRHILNAMRQVDGLLHSRSDPSLHWLPNYDDNDEGDGDDFYERNEEVFHNFHFGSEHRPLIQHTDDNEPYAECVDETCHQSEAPLSQMGSHWVDEYLENALSQPSRGLSDAEQDAIRNHPLVNAVRNAPIEEAVPEPVV